MTTLFLYKTYFEQTEEPTAAALLVLCDRVEGLSKSCRAIAHGDQDGPAGLEMVAMALVGGRGEITHGPSLASAVGSVSDAIVAAAEKIEGSSESLGQMCDAIEGLTAVAAEIESGLGPERA